jgi:transposase-like protein
MKDLRAGKTRQQFTEEFRRMVVARMKSFGRVVGLARELGVRAKFLHPWRARLEGPTKVAARVVNLKFIAEFEAPTAGPSIVFVARSAPNSVQNDRLIS